MTATELDLRAIIPMLRLQNRSALHMQAERRKTGTRFSPPPAGMKERTDCSLDNGRCHTVQAHLHCNSINTTRTDHTSHSSQRRGMAIEHPTSTSRRHCNLLSPPLFPFFSLFESSEQLSISNRHDDGQFQGRLRVACAYISVFLYLCTCVLCALIRTL